MDTGSARGARGPQHRNLAVVTLVSITAVVLTLVLAACGVTAGPGDASEQAAGHGAPKSADGPRTHRPSAQERAQVRAARDRDLIATVAAYTTTTTRPAVSPFGPPPDANVGKRLVYCNSCQTAWMIDETNYVVWSFKVSGRRGTPRAGVYHVFRKLEMGRSKSHPDLRLPYFVGFAWGSTTDIGFHGIPLRPDNSQIEADSQLGQPLSSGCVRVSQPMAKAIYTFADIGTPVVVLP